MDNSRRPLGPALRKIDDERRPLQGGHLPPQSRNFKNRIGCFCSELGDFCTEAVLQIPAMTYHSSRYSIFFHAARSPGIPGKTYRVGPGDRCAGRADDGGTRRVSQSLAAEERGGHLGPRRLAGRFTAGRPAATLPRNRRPHRRLERLSGRGRGRRLPLPRRRPGGRRLAIHLPAQWRLRFLRSAEGRSTALRTVRPLISKAAGSIREERRSPRPRRAGGRSPRRHGSLGEVREIPGWNSAEDRQDLGFCRVDNVLITLRRDAFPLHLERIRRA